jgi:hypothetical protein
MSNKKKFKCFEDARIYALKLGFRSGDEWRQWARTDARPSDIPFNPPTAYSRTGWMAGWIFWEPKNLNHLKTQKYIPKLSV